MKGQITRAILVIAISGSASLFADLQITNNSSLQLFPKVVQASGGNFVIAWCDNRQSGGHFEIRSNATNSSVSSILGGSDDDLSTPSPADGHRLHAEMVPSNDGAMVAWVDHKAQKVMALRIDQNGDIDYDFNNNTGNPVDVHPATFMTPPQMCSDGAGGAIFAYIEREKHIIGNDTIWFNHLKAKKITSSGNVEWTEDSVAVDTFPITLPRICADDNDGAMIAHILTTFQNSLLFD